MSGRMLVAGATGIVGSAVARAFAEAGWEVHATSRRPPVQPIPGVTYHAADLLDYQACANLLDAIGPIHELAYCAINEASGSLVAKWTDPEQAARNGAMFSNLMDAVQARSPDFRHVAIIHGTKAYAVHFRDRKPPVPLREDQPRVPHENFYFLQEDEVARRAAGQSWSWTVFRAPVILGGGAGTNLSSFLAFGVLAAVARAEGRPFDYPGAIDGGIFEVVDADLLGRAFLWSASAPTARNQIFNISNGDVVQWQSLWPVIARSNGVEVGADTPGASLVAAAEQIAPVWARLVEQHELAASADLNAFLGESFALAQNTVVTPVISIMSLIKLRKAGFNDCEETPAQISHWYDHWRSVRLLPPL
jgi:nucleoside-diphosphate-sugar epimerase